MYALTMVKKKTEPFKPGLPTLETYLYILCVVAYVVERI